MKPHFKPGILLLLTFILVSSCTLRKEKTISSLNQLLDSLQLQHAPDKQLELWDISVSSEEGSILLSGNLASKEAFKDVVQNVDRQFPGVRNELLLLPENGNGQLVNGLVNNSVIHLRKEPNSTKELVTQALLGTPVRILKEDGGKSLIQLPDRYLGWVNTEEVHALNLEGLTAYREAEKLVFIEQYGMAFSEPDESSLPVTDLVIGNIVSKVSEVPGYTQVKYPDGRLGWINSRDLVPAEEIFYKSTLKENLVQTALRYHGIPYLWGGTSSKNIDCSGLISNVYFMNGIQLPRDGDMQSVIGRELTADFVWDSLEPGDLLFFGRKASEGKKENVTHVAMYIGDGEFIHSAGYRERVSINSMDSTRANFIDSYPDIFVRAIRILGEEYKGFSPISENAYYKEIINTTE